MPLRMYIMFTFDTRITPTLHNTVQSTRTTFSDPPHIKSRAKTNPMILPRTIRVVSWTFAGVGVGNWVPDVWLDDDLYENL